MLSTRYGQGVDIFAEIADEREALADTLEELTAEQWQVQSLCEAWTVHDVAAHLLMPLVTPTPKVIAAMVRNLMNWDKANLTLTAGVASRSNRELVAGLREHSGSHFKPPGLGPEAPLTDVVVHGQDIRRPLGIARTIPIDRQLAILDYLTSTGAERGFVKKGLVVDLRLNATDLDWSVGEGDVVEGPAEALMMALGGRSVAQADLAGDGVGVLAERFATS